MAKSKKQLREDIAKLEAENEKLQKIYDKEIKTDFEASEITLGIIGGNEDNIEALEALLED